MACTNRIHYYAKGLKELGNQVQIIIPKPTEISGKIRNHTVFGKYEGVDFEYTCGTTIRGKSFLKRRLLVLKGIIRSSKIFLQSREKIDALILVQDYSLGYILFFKLITRLLSIIFIKEQSELPFIFRTKGSLLTRIYRKLYVNHVYRLFDCIFVISKYLYSFFEGKIHSGSKLLLVPIIVNADEFSACSSLEEGMTAIVYCGPLSQQKDGILTIIKAFKQICDKFNDARLFIIGDTNVKINKDNVLRLITKLKIKNKVILTGYVSRNELKSYLTKASLLVLAKPSGKQADSCFPTKLGEYLATGNPVITTRTGEISDYLINNKNAFLAEPDSVDSFANLMDRAIADVKTAKLIGRAGKRVAEEKFDYRIHAKRIDDFLKAIYKKKYNR